MVLENLCSLLVGVMFVISTLRISEQEVCGRGRFKSSPIDAERYLLACYRYIELNTVRAGMVDRPSSYPWSSARHHGFWINDVLISDHDLYNALGSDMTTRQKAYRELFSTEMDAELIHEMTTVFTTADILGKSRFKDEIKSVLAQSENNKD
jgi:putative transposase